MSIKAMEWAQDVRTETVAQKAVLLLLAMHRDRRTGRSQCSIPVLAMRVGLSERQVSRVVRRLEELGYVSRSQLPGSAIRYRFPALEGA